MSLVEIKEWLMRERKRVKREGASEKLLKRMEIVSMYVANTIEQMKREGIDPEGGGM